MRNSMLILIILCLLIMVLLAACGGEKEITVSFNSDGGSAVESITLPAGEALSLPEAPQREGYTFDGWVVEGDESGAVLSDGYQFPEGTTATYPEGGLFVWATLPEQIDTAALVPEMIEKNVAYVQGTPFYPNGGHANQCRLNFSSMPEERIREGIKILGDAFKEKL